MNGTAPISTSTPSSRLNEPLFKPETVTDNIQPVRFTDIRPGQAGKGTTRPPLSRNPPERLLKKIAELKQTNSMEAQADHQVPLASPIHLIPSHSTASGPQATFPYSRSHGPRPAPQNGIYVPSPSEHLIHASLSRPSPNPHPNHRAKIISSNHYTHPSPPTPNTAMPSTRSKPAMLNASILTPAPGMPRRHVPVLVSPLKIMFDNACRGIYSELSHFQSSCVAMMTREHKEKEMLKAHYFQMKRERDAARERVTLLEGSSSGSPPASALPTVLAQPDSSSQIRGVSRKRRRESFEHVSDYRGSVSPSASSSSSSSCSSAPRTPSPSNEVQVAIPCMESFELLYPESRLSTSPPPPPISSIHNTFHTPSAPPSSNRVLFCTPSPRSKAQPLSSATSTPLRGRMARIPIPPSRITSPHSTELAQPDDSAETSPGSKRFKASITVYPSDAEAASTGGRYFDVLKSSSLASPTSSEGDVRNVEDLVNFDESVDMELESDDDSDADIPPTLVPGVGERGFIRRKMVSRTPSFVLPSLREMYPGYPPLSPKQQCTSILDIRSL